MNKALSTDEISLSYRERIEDAVAENQIVEALNTLQDLVRDFADHLRPAMLMLRRRYRQFEQEKLLGLAQQQELDSIVEQILYLLSEAQRTTTKTQKLNLPEAEPDKSDFANRGGLRLVRSEPNTASVESETTTSPIKPIADARLGADQFDSLDTLRRGYWHRFRDGKPPEETIAFACEGITKSFSRFRLGELSFSLRTGQITGVVGRNASGKTTLLRLIRSELLADSGHATYPQLTLDGNSWTAIKRQIAYIPQFPRPWTGTVRRNLLFAAATSGHKPRRIRDLLDWHIQRYGLADYENASHAKLSGGYRMRYELVRALVSRPRLLILDEPLASLDVLARQEFLKNLQAIAYSLEEPIPVILTSQHLYDMEGVADQMIVLEDGKCLFCGPLQEIGAKSPLRLFELTIAVARRLLQDAVKPYNGEILETQADGYILSVPNEVHVSDLARVLIERFGQQLVGFREITSSSRRFFVRGVH